MQQNCSSAIPILMRPLRLGIPRKVATHLRIDVDEFQFNWMPESSNKTHRIILVDSAYDLVSPGSSLAGPRTVHLVVFVIERTASSPGRLSSTAQLRSGEINAANDVG